MMAIELTRRSMRTCEVVTSDPWQDPTDELPAVDIPVVDIPDKSGTLTVKGLGAGNGSEKQEQEDSLDVLDSTLHSDSSFSITFFIQVLAANTM
jgi:hypothetical protein